jgi:hypothetical protein
MLWNHCVQTGGEEEVICSCLFCSVGVCVMWWASVQHLLWDCKCEEMGVVFCFLWAWPLRGPVVLKRVIPEYTNPWQPLVLVDQRLYSSVRFLFCWAHCNVDGTCSCPLTKLSVIFFCRFLFLSQTYWKFSRDKIIKAITRGIIYKVEKVKFPVEKWELLT